MVASFEAFADSNTSLAYPFLDSLAPKSYRLYTSEALIPLSNTLELSFCLLVPTLPVASIVGRYDDLAIPSWADLSIAVAIAIFAVGS